MKYLNIDKKLLRILLIAILLILPWFNGNYFDETSASIPSQEDLSFYEINTCNISLFEFLIKNPNSIYQDHFFFRFDDYSSIECFGKITGVTLVNNGFFVSVGTNTLLNLLIQSIFWITVFSFVPKDEKQLSIKKTHYFSSIILVSYFLTYIRFQ